MKKRILGIVLAISLVIPTMPVMASENQGEQENVTLEQMEEVTEVSEVFEEEVIEEETPEVPEEEVVEEETPEVPEEEVVEEETPEVPEEEVIEEETPEVSEEEVIEEETTEVPEEEVVEEETIEVPEEEVIEEEAPEVPEEEVIEEEATEVPEEEVIEEEATEVLEEEVIEEETAEVIEATAEEESLEDVEEVTELEIIAVTEDEVTGAGEVAISGGSSKENATSIALGTTYVSQITNSVWYKLTVSSNAQPGYYRFYGDRITSTHSMGFYVYDNLGAELFKKYYSDNAKYTAKLTPGSTYYVKVDSRGTTGNFFISVTYTADPEGDSIADAKRLEKDVVYRGTNGKKEDPDFYKITTDAAGYYRINITNESIYRLGYKFQTQWGQDLKGWNHVYKPDTGYFTMLLDANTPYYLWISGDEEASGNYTVSYTYLPDNEGNTQETAYPLTMGTEYRGTNAIKEDPDFFKITTGVAGYYQIKVTNESIYRIGYKLRSQYEQDLTDWNHAYKSDTKYLTKLLDANTPYYLWISGDEEASGNYTVSYKYLPDNEGDNQDTAIALMEGKEYETTLCTGSDVDYYKIVPQFSGRYIIKLVNRDCVRNMDYTLFTEYGEQLKYMSWISTGNDSVLEYSLTKGTTYYLRAKGGSEGNYMITFKKDFPFTDVNPMKEGHWQYEAVEYVYENGIMSGKNTTMFDPGANITRAEFAQILYNMAGKPSVGYKSVFSDVPKGQWYTNAVMWAYNKGIVSGYSDGRYGIKDNITREQVAKMLYMYSEYKGNNVSYRADLSGFPDNRQVSGWAKPYVQWAVSMKVISGKTVNGKLNLVPKGQATRAECAAMISKYMKNS